MRSIATAAVSLGFMFVLLSCADGTRSKTADVTQITPTEVAADAGLENVFLLPGDVINGSAPMTDAAFEALESMGVKTIVSVDGARPNVDAARARGMRYVHIPIGYDDVSREDADKIALALRDLPRPIYIHCHHGKHRGPAAIAVGMVCTGEMTNDEAVSFLELAGTSHSYPGLYVSAESARPIDWTGDFRRGEHLPEIVKVEGFVAAMSGIDRTWDRVKVIQAANWDVPRDHPDLVPAAEAGMLVELLRASIESKYAVRPGSTGAMVATANEDPAMAAPTAQMTFDGLLQDALVAANGLEEALVAGDRSGADRWFSRVKANCTACHEQFRN